MADDSQRGMYLLGWRHGQEATTEEIAAWLRSSPRKPPELAFTAGPERELADEILLAIQRAKEQA